MAANTTAIKLLSRVPRHLAYVGYEKFYSCYTNPEFVTVESVCRYVQTTLACNNVVNIFNYLNFLVCGIHVSRDTVAGMMTMYSFALALSILYLFILYVVGRYFIYPNVIMLSEYWKMRDFHFGVVVIMAVIVLPSIIITLSSCQAHESNGSLLFTELLAKVFMCFVAGIISICLSRNCSLIPGIFCLNMALIMGGGIYLFETMYFNMVNDHSPIEKRSSFNVVIHAIFMLFVYAVYLLMIILRSKPSVNRSVVELTAAPPAAPAVDLASLASDDYSIKENPIEDVDAWEMFFLSCNIFANDVDTNIVLKMLVAPIWFVVSFLVPVVTKSRPLDGWCKFQTITSLILFPLLFYFLSNEVVFYALMLVCVLGAILTFVKTKRNQIPNKHMLYGMFGIFAGLTIYETLDTEIRALLWQVLSFSADWDSDANIIFSSMLCQVLYVSIFCCALVEGGRPEMAYGMVLGVTMFFTYASLPLLAFHVCPYREKTAIQANTEMTYYFMLITYCLVILGVALANFELRKSHGFVVLYVSAVYILMLLLSAISIMHPLGSQHAIRIFRDTNHASWA